MFKDDFLEQAILQIECMRNERMYLDRCCFKKINELSSEDREYMSDKVELISAQLQQDRRARRDLEIVCSRLDALGYRKNGRKQCQPGEQITSEEEQLRELDRYDQSRFRQDAWIEQSVWSNYINNKGNRGHATYLKVILGLKMDEKTAVEYLDSLGDGFHTMDDRDSIILAVIRLNYFGLKDEEHWQIPYQVYTILKYYMIEKKRMFSKAISNLYKVEDSKKGQSASKVDAKMSQSSRTLNALAMHNDKELNKQKLMLPRELADLENQVETYYHRLRYSKIKAELERFKEPSGGKQMLAKSLLALSQLQYEDKATDDEVQKRTEQLQSYYRELYEGKSTEEKRLTELNKYKNRCKEARKQWAECEQLALKMKELGEALDGGSTETQSVTERFLQQAQQISMWKKL